MIAIHLCGLPLETVNHETPCNGIPLNNYAVVTTLPYFDRRRGGNGPGLPTPARGSNLSSISRLLGGCRFIIPVRKRSAGAGMSTFVIVPGAWDTPAVVEPLLEPLE